MYVRVPKIIEGNFQEVINEVIQEGRHVEYLKNALKEYEQYKKVFSLALTDKNPPNSVYLFRVTYLSKENVWRDIAIFGSRTFEDLAEAIIDSMDWDNDHMHGFSLPDKQKKDYLYHTKFTFFAEGWEDDPYPTYKSNQIKICNINYDIYPKLRFEFDFGDSHMFEVHLKEMRKPLKGEKIKTLPKLLDQRVVAPEQYPGYEEEWDEKGQLDEAKESLNGRFSPFFAKFPELTASENKTLELVFADKSIPKAEYLLIENYCDGHTCDCRKVMINIIDKKDPSRILVTIGFGWESLDFYKQWAHGDEWLAKEMKGVYLELGGIQSEESNGWGKS